MTKHTQAPLRHNIFACPIGPQIYLAPEDGGGSGDDAAAKAAAEAAAAAAAKAAEEAAAKAAADKKAADEAAALETAKKAGMSDEAAKLLKENMEKKAALAAAEAEKTALAEKLKRFDGIDPDEVKKLLDAQKKAEQEAAEKAGDFERVKKMMADEAEKKIKAVADEKEALEKQNQSLNSTIQELTVGQAFLASDFIKNELILTPSKTRVIYGANFEVENGMVVGYDKPKGQSERTKLVDSTGTPLGFDAALARLVDKDPEKDDVKKSKMAKGTGGKPSVPGGKTDDAPTELTGAARMKAALEAAAAAKK